jgi:hypothetical protein
MAAKRDMTRAQFQAALKRNGFRQFLAWFQDETGQTTSAYGAVVNPKTGKIYRRITLARIIEERRRDAAKKKGPV